MRKVNTKIDWLNLIVGAVIGILIALPAEAGWNRVWKILHKNEEALDEANRHRHLMTDQDFAAARVNYQYVIDHAGLKHNLKVRAYQGMSRNYSEWAIVRFARGLSKKQYPDLAQKYAALAEKEASADLETGLAIAYSYLAQETGNPKHPLTEEKAKELLVKHPRNIELLYLAQEPSFYDNANPTTIDNFLVLLNLWTYFARNAQNTTDSAEQNRNLKRAEGFLDAADRINPDHELVLYRRGYVAQSFRKEWSQAALYYEAALRKQPEFPQASLNLAAIYASWGQYGHAKDQFHDVIVDEDVPIESRTMALHNLGEVDLELKDTSGACDAWRKATTLENITTLERLLSTVHTAMCQYEDNDLSNAKKTYATAIQLAEGKGLCLQDMTAYTERWKVGPAELDLAKALNKSVGKSKCTPPSLDSRSHLVAAVSH